MFTARSIPLAEQTVKVSKVTFLNGSTRIFVDEEPGVLSKIPRALPKFISKVASCERENPFIFILTLACGRRIPPPAKQNGSSESSHKIGAQNEPPPPFSARSRARAIVESILFFDSHTP